MDSRGRPCGCSCYFFFFNDTATTEIYTLSLHDALPISRERGRSGTRRRGALPSLACHVRLRERSEEHTSELQSPCNSEGGLLLEKKKNQRNRSSHNLHYRNVVPHKLDYPYYSYSHTHPS